VTHHFFKLNRKKYFLFHLEQKNVRRNLAAKFKKETAAASFILIVEHGFFCSICDLFFLFEVAIPPNGTPY